VTVPVRRRRRGLRALLITVLVLVVLLVVADRVGAAVAERVAADTIQRSQHLDQRPDVDVPGIPFLTQLASGTFDKVTIHANDVAIGNSAHTLDISHVAVDLDHVTVPRDFSAVHARTAHATGLISYQQLGRVLGIDVTYRGGGRVRAEKTITVLGQTFQAGITATPQLVDGALGFGAAAVNGVSGVGQDVIDGLTKVFDLRVPFDRFPFGVRVRSLQATAQGISLALDGSNLSYQR
jgi:hypothetical protein